MTRLLAQLALLLGARLEDPECISPASIHWTSGYVRGHHSDHTADGTNIWNGEHLVATGPEYPFRTVLWIDGLGYYRVADRGSGVGVGHIDVLVDSEREAFAITSRRLACAVEAR